MDVEEKRLLEAFLSRLVAIPQIVKDRAAAVLIESAFERQPNAAYLVVQRALILERALEASRSEVARLQARLQQGPGAQSAPSFLGSEDWGAGAGAPSSDARAGRRAAVVNEAGPPQRPPPKGTGFLGQAAMLAAGVAGGAFLFHGVSALAASSAVAGTRADDPGLAPALGPEGDEGVPAAAGAAPGSPLDEAPGRGPDFDLGTDLL